MGMVANTAINGTLNLDASGAQATTHGPHQGPRPGKDDDKPWRMESHLSKLPVYHGWPMLRANYRDGRLPVVQQAEGNHGFIVGLQGGKSGKVEKRIDASIFGYLTEIPLLQIGTNPKRIPYPTRSGSEIHPAKIRGPFADRESRSSQALSIARRKAYLSPATVCCSVFGSSGQFVQYIYQSSVLAFQLLLPITCAHQTSYGSGAPPAATDQTSRLLQPAHKVHQPDHPLCFAFFPPLRPG
ncbi:MAG: hypothetical protein Q9174_000768 [Haloplaca sp. 1 TL-2023]